MKHLDPYKCAKMSLSSSIITLSDSDGESEDPKVYTIDESNVADDSRIEVVTLDDSNANQSKSCAVDTTPSFIPVPNVFSRYGAVLRRGRRRPLGATPEVVGGKKPKRSDGQTIALAQNRRTRKFEVVARCGGSAKKSKVTGGGEGSAKKLGEGSAKKLGEGSAKKLGEGSAKKLKGGSAKKLKEGSAKKSKGEGSAKKLKAGSAKKSKVTRRGEGSAKKLRAGSAKKSKVTGNGAESTKMVASKVRRKHTFAGKSKITRIQLSHTNIHGRTDSPRAAEGLRPVIIDGCNVAFGFGNGKFEIEGILMVVEYFQKRGHQEIVCFLPQCYRNKPRPEAISKRVKELEKENIIVYTPSRVLDSGQLIKPYDDRYVLQYASEREGVIISNDGYLDLINEEPSWRITIEQRIINFTFVRGLLMLPKDPLGPNGPTLDEVLRFPAT